MSQEFFSMFTKKEWHLKIGIVSTIQVSPTKWAPFVVVNGVIMSPLQMAGVRWCRISEPSTVFSPTYNCKKPYKKKRWLGPSYASSIHGWYIYLHLPDFFQKHRTKCRSKICRSSQVLAGYKGSWSWKGGVDVVIAGGAWQTKTGTWKPRYCLTQTARNHPPLNWYMCIYIYIYWYIDPTKTGKGNSLSWANYYSTIPVE